MYFPVLWSIPDITLCILKHTHRLKFCRTYFHYISVCVCVCVITVDECLNGTAHMCTVETPEDGRVDGICQDLLGSYECLCPDGYEFDSVQGGCTGKFSSCSSLSL